MRKLGSNKMPVFMLVDRTNVSDEIFIFAAFINELEMELRRDFTSDDTATVKKDEGEKDVNVDKRDEREKDAKVEKRNEGEKDAMVEKRDEGEKNVTVEKRDGGEKEKEKDVTVEKEKRDGGEKEKDVTVEKEKRDGGWKEKERNVTVEKQLDDMCDQKKRKKKFCQNCGIEREKGLLKCKSCKRVRYCDIVCQRADWHNEHSMFCRL